MVRMYKKDKTNIIHYLNGEIEIMEEEPERQKYILGFETFEEFVQLIKQDPELAKKLKEAL